MNTAHREKMIESAYDLMEVPRSHKDYLVQTYLWVGLYLNCYGYAPTYEEIGKRFGISGEAVFKRITRLVKLGYLRMPFGKQRGIELVGGSSERN